MTAVDRLPEFVVIGAERSATRWLRSALAEHPDIYLPPRPVDHFTDRSGRRSERSYRLAFKDAGDAALIGDCSPSYLLASNHPTSVAVRMAEALPEAKLVAIVRDPVDRMFSSFRNHVIRGNVSPDADLFQMVRTRDPDVAALDLVAASRYAECLYPFRCTFGDRLLVVCTQDLATEPAGVVDCVLDHIGASTGFVPSRLDQILYSNAHSRWVRSSVPSDEERRLLYMLFRRDVEELESMIDRYLPEWDPGPPPADWRELLGVDAADEPRRADAAG